MLQMIIEGYTSDSGAHGQRGYFGNYMFVWVGAVADIPYRVHTRSVNIGTLQKRIEALRMVGRPLCNICTIQGSGRFGNGGSS